MIGIGVGISAYGQYKAGKAAKKAGQQTAAAQVKAGEAAQASSESEAQLADFNAQVTDLQAKDAIERGAEQESQFRASVRGIIGSQRAGQAANNVDVSYGSTVDVQADAAYLGELDAMTIRTNAAREAWGFKVQGQDYRKRAEIARKEGVYRKEAGGAAATGSIAAGNAQATANYLGAASTIATGAGSALQARYGFQNRTTARTTLGN
jgi:hypothetical protein